VVIGLDETVARRRGEKLSAKGLSRAPVRSSHAPFVSARGLRWVSLMRRTRIPWAERAWALPFLTVLAPPARYYHSRGRQPQSRLARARQAWRLMRRGLPTRALVGVGATTSAALEGREAVRQAAGVLTRWRREAAL
jgi:hypothetical protein